MADVIVYLEGGPCDGTNHILTVAEGDEGTVVCKGGYYHVTNPVRIHNGDAIYAYAGKVPKPPPPPTLKAPHALGGWKALRKSVNRGMPDALHYSQGLNTAALRSLARARRVRL